MLKRFKGFADGWRGSAAVVSMSAADIGKLRAFADPATAAEIELQLESKPFVKLSAVVLCELIDALLAKHNAPPPAPLADSTAKAESAKAKTKAAKAQAAKEKRAREKAAKVMKAKDEADEGNDDENAKAPGREDAKD